MTGSDESSAVLRLPFVFVPDGAPDPVEWRARHPGWISIPATLILPAGSKRQFGHRSMATKCAEREAPRILRHVYWESWTARARVPGWRRYNSVDPAWRQKVLAVIATIERRRPLWSGPR